METPNETTETPQPAPAAPDTAALQAEVFRSRFEAVAARAGLDDDYLDEVGAKAEKWLADQKLDGTKENLSKFLDEFRGKKPKLFATPTQPRGPANTAPVVPNAQPAAPAPAAVTNPFTQWRALVESGRRAEAEAFYRLNHRAINRQ